MRAIFFLFLALAACAKNSDMPTAALAAAQAPILMPTPIACNMIDTCTYSGGVFPRPTYNCVSTTYQALEHPEIDSYYFAGESCLTTKEDYLPQMSYCGPPGGPQFPCQIEVQGPGPAAIPGI